VLNGWGEVQRCTPAQEVLPRGEIRFHAETNDAPARRGASRRNSSASDEGPRSPSGMRRSYNVGSFLRPVERGWKLFAGRSAASVRLPQIVARGGTSVAAEIHQVDQRVIA
jgi:hypothetical protein